MDRDLLAFVSGLDPIVEDDNVAAAAAAEKNAKRGGKKQAKLKKLKEAVPLTTNEAVSMADLAAVIGDDTGFAGLKKRLEDLDSDHEGEAEIENDKKRHKKSRIERVQAPLPDSQRQSIERQVAYEHSRRELNRWAPLVKKNREAVQLHFGGVEETATVASSLVGGTIQPRTPFEQALAAVTAGQNTNQDASLPTTLASMPANRINETELEAQRRAHQRALQSFRASKQLKQSRIKSKTYRKIKGRDSKKEAEVDDLEVPDAQALQERRVQAELARARERLTLRTRKASRWAQEMLHRRRGVMEPATRLEVIEQLRDKERLRQELVGTVEADESSEEEDDGEFVEDLYQHEGEEHDDSSGLEDDDDAVDDDEEEGEEENDELAVVGRRQVGAAPTVVKAHEAGEEDEDGGSEGEEGWEEKVSKAKKRQPVKTVIKSVATNNAALIKEAFAEDDDLFAQAFAEERASVQAADAPREEDLTLPGWGSWSGAGLAAPTKRMVRPIAGLPTQQRKDARLKHVIINERRNRAALATLCVPKVPYPFRTREEWQQAISKPLGKEWNAARVHRKRVEPRIRVQAGSIIDPIKFVKQAPS